MGCTSSAPVQVSPTSKGRRRTNAKQSEKPAPRKGRALFLGNPHEAKSSDVNRQDLRSLTTDCYTVHKSPGIVPICCLSDVSMPLVVARMSLVSGEETDLTFPVFAISRLEMGRVICLGDFEMLTRCSPDSDNDMMFVENMLRWAGGPTPAVRMALIYGLDSDVAEKLTTLMMGFGFGFEVKRNGEIEFQKYQMLFLRSDCEIRDGMLEFLMAGGCIVCAPAELTTPNRFRLNQVIGEAGIGFVEGPFSITDAEGEFKFDLSMTDLQHYRLPNLVRQFVEVMNGGDVQLETMEKLVTYLRYHIRLLVYRGQLPELYDVCVVSLKYLILNNYIEKNVICSEYQEAMLGVLISESFKKMLTEQMVFDLSTPFPGRSQQYSDLKEFVLACPYSGIYSTGLYLKANTRSLVSMAREIKGLKVQIGSHSEDLSRKPFPWKRFPNVVMQFDIHQGDTEIASPFGGLLYFIVEKPNEEEVLKFQVRVTDISKGPCYTYKKRKKWTTRKDADVPVAEFIGKKVIFTLPTSYARDMPSVEQTMTTMDEIIDALDSTSGNVIKFRPYRVVFDVELMDGNPICGYPCVFDYTWIDAIFNPDAPTAKLFNFLSILALSSMPSNMFSPLISPLIAMTCAWNVFRHRFPNEPVSNYFSYESADTIAAMIKQVKSNGIDSFTQALTQVRKNANDNTIPLEGNEVIFCKLFMSDKEQADDLLSLMRQIDDQYSSAVVL